MLITYLKILLLQHLQSSKNSILTKKKKNTSTLNLLNILLNIRDIHDKKNNFTDFTDISFTRNNSRNMLYYEHLNNH